MKRSRAPEIQILFWQLVARFPAGMMTIGLLTLAEQRFGNYVHGGLLAGAFTLGFAVGSSLSTRLLRIFGSALVLRVDTGLSASCLVLLAFLPSDFPVAALLATAIGLTFPPITPLARSLYPRLSNGPRLLRVYSLDSIAQEGIWLLAPICAIGVAGGIGPGYVLVLCAAFVLLGTLRFAGLAAVRRHEPRDLPAVERASRSVRGHVIGFSAIGFFLVASGAFIEVSLVERFGYHSPMAGVLLALTASGSIVGGVVFARQTITQYSLTLRMMIVAVGLALAAVAPSSWVLAVGLFLSGGGIAPAFTAMHARIAVVAPPSRAAEIYAFANTMQLVGLASGSAIAGLLVTVASSGAALFVGAGCVIAAMAVALLVGRHDRG